MFTRAIVREPAETFDRGITTSTLGPPDYGRMLEQHRAYVRLLESFGLTVIRLEARPEFPDAHFVEDTAVVTPRVAVITRPGAAARRGEEQSIEPVLGAFRPIERIRPPGTVDGGDVLMAGNRFFVGISDRTNREGAGQLCRILGRYGHEPHQVEVAAGLHLKSSLNIVGEKTLLMTPAFSGLKALDGFHHIILDESESYAANTLLINGRLVMPAGFPETRLKLEALGLPIAALDVSEVRKMDGGLTCLSLRF